MAGLSPAVPGHPTRSLHGRPLDFLLPAPQPSLASFPEPRCCARPPDGPYRTLDACGRRVVWPADRLLSKGRNGLFASANDNSRDRTVLGARVPNVLEGGQDRCLPSLGSLEQLTRLFTPPGHGLAVYCEDLVRIFSCQRSCDVHDSR